MACQPTAPECSPAYLVHTGELPPEFETRKSRPPGHREWQQRPCPAAHQPSWYGARRLATAASIDRALSRRRLFVFRYREVSTWRPQRKFPLRKQVEQLVGFEWRETAMAQSGKSSQARPEQIRGRRGRSRIAAPLSQA